ncbi:hypothetical protein NG99_17055 [Erwinia typographi]|uniref:Prophage protein n=1 Tax=Erwinia typographi TaxID=371042 RepID=A0A0A3YWP0_9GAMM|nr:hypothetical protein [Erwinia typographi]KGT91272.1 hypothetical protein NG99_17055 [Erwinia typographi]
MKVITKNFRLNALANSYSTAILEHVCKQNGGPHFQIIANGYPVTIQIVGGVSGVRQLVDAYYFEALKLNYQGWEALGIATISQCLINGSELTSKGKEVWESMIADMGASVEGGPNAS